MNKLFTKIAGIALGLSMAIGVGAAVASNTKEATPVHAASVTTGTQSSLTFSSSHKVTASGNTIDDSAGATWTFATDSSYINFDNDGIHTGSGSKSCKYQTWTTPDYSGVTISSVVVNASTNGTASASVTINGNAVGSAQSLGSAANKTFTNSDSYKGGDLVVNLSRDQAATKNIYLYSITVNYSAGTSYTTTVSVTGGAKSTTNTSTAFSSSTKSGDVYLTPSEGYRIPTSGLGSAFTISTGTATISSITDNSDGDVKVSLTGVSSNFTISGAFEVIPTYNVTYSAGSNGSGSYTHTSQPEGTYTLLAFNSLTGVSANSGYRFKNYTVGGVDKDPGDTFTLSGTTTVTVNFEVQPNEATYEPTSVSAASQSGIYPTGATVTFANTYKSNKEQITGGNSQTWTISGYAGKLIKKITFSLRNNSKSGAGTINVTVGSTNIVTDYSVTGLGDSYVTRDVYTAGTADVKTNEDITIVIAASTNSVFCNSIVIEWDDSDILDEDLTISDDYTDSFIVGDEFEFGGSYIKAEYSGSGLVTVTDDVTFELGGESIEEGDTITAKMVDDNCDPELDKNSATVEIAVWYEDAKGNVAAGSYTVTISYEKVTSVEITTYTDELAKDGKFTFGATVYPSNANQAVTWSASSEDLTEDEDFSINPSTGYLDVDASDGGTITVTATTVGKKSNDESATASIDVTITGAPVVTLNNSSLDGFSGKTGSLTASSSNFSGTVTYSWTSNNACVTVPNSNVATNTLTYVSAGTATITVTATYGNESASATCTVTVTASTVTSLSWSASNFDVYDNQSLTALPGTLTATWNNGDTTHPTSGYTLAIGSSSISLPHAWSTNDDGKSFTITYGGQSASVSVQVTEHLNAINETAWTRVTDDSTLASGDKIIITGYTASNNYVATTMNSGYLNLSKTLTYSSDGSRVESMDSNTAIFTLGGNSSAWTLTSSGGQLYSSAAKNVNYSSSGTGTWTISVSDGDAEIWSTTTSYGRILVNTSATRFTTYASSTSTSASMLLPRIYKQSSTNIADTNSTAQRALISFAKTFNTTMACDDGGDTANIASKWSSVTSAFTTTLSGLSSDNQVVLKKLVANASSVEGGDTLQDMLARYDYIVAKYKLGNSDFLHSSAGRGAVSYSPKVTPISIFGSNSNNMIPVIVVISMISVTAVGGYFFLRKRKEQ